MPATLLPASEFPGNPPWHFNCRTVLIPVVKSWADLIEEADPGSPLAKVVQELPDSTRASMDGQVAADMNYEGWLKTKPDAFQKEVLGPARHKMWKSGQLTFADMIDPTGRSLTLAELKAKIMPDTTLPAATAGTSDWKGYPMTGLLRWAGSVGLKPKQARQFMTALGLNPADNTIYIQTRRGAKGDSVPLIADGHLVELKAYVEAVKSGQPLKAPVITPKPLEDIPPVTAPPIPSTVTSGVTFPATAKGLKSVKSLGGSTGAMLVEDTHGNRFVMRKGASADHLREEFIAEELYRSAGVPVPPSKLYDEPGGPVKLSQYVEGNTLNNVTGKARQLADAQLRKHFATDAFMGNWDVMGMNADNILVDKNGVPWRIDVGGSLRYRAMGAKKDATEWGEHPLDLWTMRDASKGGAAVHGAKVFGTLTPADIAGQANALLANRPHILATAPAELRDVLSKRLDALDRYQKAATRLTNDKFRPEYVNEFTRQQMLLRQAGIPQRFPKQLTNNSTHDYHLYDENGKLWDSLKGGPDNTMQHLANYIKSQGGDYKIIEKWAQHQGGTSDAIESEGVRAWFAGIRTAPIENYYWRKEGKGSKIGDPSINKEFGYSKAKSWLQTFGTKDQVDKTFTAFHAFNYEFFDNVSLPNSNPQKGLIQLHRTEGSDVMKMHGMKPGDKKLMIRGAESCSLVRRVDIRGHELTIQYVEPQRCFGFYAFGRNPTTGGQFFLSESENEVFALLEGLEGEYKGGSGAASVVWKDALPNPLPKASPAAYTPSYSGYQSPPVEPPKPYHVLVSQAVATPILNDAKAVIGDSGIGFSKLTGAPGSVDNFNSYKTQNGKLQSHDDFVAVYFQKDPATGKWVSKASKHSDTQAVATGLDADFTPHATGTFHIDMDKAGSPAVEKALTAAETAANSGKSIDEVFTAYKVAGGGKIKSEFVKTYVKSGVKITPTSAPTPSVSPTAPPASTWMDAVTKVTTNPSQYVTVEQVQSLLGDIDIDIKPNTPALKAWDEYKKAGGKLPGLGQFKALYCVVDDNGIYKLKPKSAPGSVAVAAKAAKGFNWAKAHIDTGIDWASLASKTEAEAYYEVLGKGHKIGDFADFKNAYTSQLAAVVQKNTGVVHTVADVAKSAAPIQTPSIAPPTGSVGAAKKQKIVITPKGDDNELIKIADENGDSIAAVKAAINTPGDMATKYAKYKTFAEAVIDNQFEFQQTYFTTTKPLTKYKGDDLPLDQKIAKAKKLANAYMIKSLLADPAFPQSAGGGPLGSVGNFNAYSAGGGVVPTYTDYLAVYFTELEDGLVQIKLPASKVKTPPTKLEK